MLKYAKLFRAHASPILHQANYLQPQSNNIVVLSAIDTNSFNLEYKVYPVADPHQVFDGEHLVKNAGLTDTIYLSVIDLSGANPSAFWGFILMLRGRNTQQCDRVYCLPQDKLDLIQKISAKKNPKFQEVIQIIEPYLVALNEQGKLSLLPDSGSLGKDFSSLLRAALPDHIFLQNDKDNIFKYFDELFEDLHDLTVLGAGKAKLRLPKLGS